MDLLGDWLSIGIERNRRGDLLHTQLADLVRQVVSKVRSSNFMSQWC